MGLAGQGVILFRDFSSIFARLFVSLKLGRSEDLSEKRTEPRTRFVRLPMRFSASKTVPERRNGPQNHYFGRFWTIFGEFPPCTGLGGPPEAILSYRRHYLRPFSPPHSHPWPCLGQNPLIFAFFDNFSLIFGGFRAFKRPEISYIAIYYIYKYSTVKTSPPTRSHTSEGLLGRPGRARGQVCSGRLVVGARSRDLLGLSVWASAVMRKSKS